MKWGRRGEVWVGGVKWGWEGNSVRHIVSLGYK